MGGIPWIGLRMAGVALAIVSCALFVSASAQDEAADRPRVFFIYGAVNSQDSWTTQLMNIGHAAAEDLNIDFEIVFSGPGRKEIYDKAAEYLSENRPDYALVVNYRSGAEHTLRFLDERGIKSFLFNADLTEAGKQAVGEPREQLDNWLGRMIPDDEIAGYDLARYLFAEARKSKPGETINAIGITGAYASTAAVKRMEGLRRAAEEADDVDLKQVVTARWSPPTAREKYELLKNRYGAFDVVWVANDGMALGVTEAIDFSMEDVKVGGMDWTAGAIEAIENGEMTASMGGHVLDIGYSLALIRLYHDGCDFADTPEEVSLRSRLSLMTSETMQYRDLARSQDWERLDFSVITCDFVKSEDFGDLSIDKFFSLSGKGS